MIQTKLLLIEYSIINESKNNQWKLKTVRLIRDLLAQIDFGAEVVPVENANKLTGLLSSLKGSDLNHEEKLLVKELVTI